MAVVGMILHHEREQAAELARDAAAWRALHGYANSSLASRARSAE